VPDARLAGVVIMKTYLPKQSEIEHKWYVVDASDKVLGRLAVEIANTIRGRKKPIYTPHLDTGDFVIVVNAEKVKVTGGKEIGKKYDFYSGWMGGQRFRTVSQLRQQNPVRLIQLAVWGMMPHTKLGRAEFTKLKVYAGPDHPHQAQQPEPLKL